MLRSCLLVILVALLGWAAVLSAAEPSLIADLNTDRGNPNEAPLLSDFTPVGPRAVFVVRQGKQDDEQGWQYDLWASDGTGAGTEKLRSFLTPALAMLGGNGRIAFFLDGFFRGFSGLHGALWRTDGTAAGTFPLTGPITDEQGTFTAAVHAGSLFFAGCTPETGCEPWVSDGTAAGTRRLADITPGEYGSAPRQLTSLGPLLYFFADDPDGTGLWRTDGTPEGTRRVALLPPFSLPSRLRTAGSRLFFALGPEDAESPRLSLWTSDGTPAGTRPVPPFDRARGRGPAVADLLGSLGDLQLFVGSDPVVGLQVWRTDGTPRGTRRLTSFPAPGFSSPFPGTGTVPLGGRAAFVGPGGQIWTTRGTRASTQPLAGCAGGCPVVRGQSREGPALVARGGLAFFAGSPSSQDDDIEPWVTDGTPGGTFRLADVCAGACGSFLWFGPAVLGRTVFYDNHDLWITDGTPGGTHFVAPGAYGEIAAAGQRAVFAGFSGQYPDIDAEIRSTDGTPEGTTTLDLQLADGAGSDPEDFIPFGDGVLFVACSGKNAGLWKLGGTPGTAPQLLKAWRVFCDDSGFTRIVPAGDVVYFLAEEPGVWRTDGTPGGTYLITPRLEEYLMDFTLFRGKPLFFTYRDSTRPGPVGVWTSDGMPQGTVRLFTLNLSYTSGLHAVGDEFFFVDQFSGHLFRSDGTEEGTRELAAVASVDRETDWIRLGGHTFFLASYPGDGAVWKTDGTPEGTYPFILPADTGHDVLGLAQLGDRIFFMGLETDFEGEESVPTLFRSDGTVAGTARIKTFSLASELDFPAPQFAAAGGTLFFVAADEAHGSELWKTDGTRTGTVLVRDIAPGPASSRIGALTAAGDRVFFAADDGEHGSELWTSDGTAAGTRLMADIAPGPLSSSPRKLAPAGDRLFFSADDGVVGREPWVLPLASTLSGRIAP
jgi:ELWxxDGT repeat protein